MESWVDDNAKRGREADRVRRSGALRLAWDLPDDDQVRRFLSLVDQQLGDPSLSRETLEPIILALLILQSGRSPDALLHSILTVAPPGATIATESPGILVQGREAVILLESAGAATPAPVALPALPSLAWASRLLAAMIPIGGRIFASTAAQLNLGLRRLLDKQPFTSKAVNGDAALRRWLSRRLRDAMKGDPALEAMITRRKFDVSTTLHHYYAIEAEVLWVRYQQALTPLAITTTPLPAAFAGRRHGALTCPTDDEVRAAVAALVRILKRPAIDPALRGGGSAGDDDRLGLLPIRRTRHLAMMIYTFALVTFGTGQRGHQALADSDAIDPETGFAWIREKGNLEYGTDGERGVFHSPLVRQQIAIYERYLSDLANRLARHDEGAANVLRQIAARPGLQFVDIQEAKVFSLNHADLQKQARQLLGWPLVKNAGRKWLRSALGGAVPSDAIAAQFGHHHDGFDVWSRWSGLRPTEVRQWLRAIDPLLKGVGFAPQGGEPVPLAMRAPNLPDFAVMPKSRRAQAGRIVASAMWHGALLDPDRQQAMLEAATRALRTDLPEWLDLDRASYAAQERWFIDPTTASLLNQQRRFGERSVESNVAAALFAYFEKLTPKKTGEIISPVAIQKDVDSFSKLALRRWRFRLPPFLFYAACAKLKNHSLGASTFDPDQARPPARPDTRRRRLPWERRKSFNDIQVFLEQCWPSSGLLAARKAHASLKGKTLTDENFFKQMSPLEQSLAFALVIGFHAPRSHPSPEGDGLATIQRRAERLWRHFVPLERAIWEDQPIGDMEIEAILRRLPMHAPWRGDVANDIATLLIDIGARSPSSDDVTRLRRVDNSHTATMLRAREYAAISNQAQPTSATTAIAISYRLGLRVDELRWIDTCNIGDHHGLTTLSLDHDRDRRLKTFHSRRYLPIQMLLTQDELCLLQQAAKSREWNDALHRIESAYDQSCADVLKEVTCVPFNLFPLRHSFATNVYAALLWPVDARHSLERFFDPLLIERRKKLQRHLCDAGSLGATALHAIALLMGHTHPWRAVFNYVHNLEVVLAAHVRAVARSSTAGSPELPQALAA